MTESCSGVVCLPNIWVGLLLPCIFCGLTCLETEINDRNLLPINHKEIPGKKVEVVWACDERGSLRRKEGDGNEGTGEKEERGRPKRRWLDKVKDDTPVSKRRRDCRLMKCTTVLHGGICPPHIKVGIR